LCLVFDFVIVVLSCQLDQLLQIGRSFLILRVFDQSLAKQEVSFDETWCVCVLLQLDGFFAEVNTPLILHLLEVYHGEVSQICLLQFAKFFYCIQEFFSRAIFLDIVPL